MKPDQHDFGVAMVFGQLQMISHAILQKQSKSFVTQLYKLHQHILNVLVDFTPKQKNLIWADAYEMLIVSFPDQRVRSVLVKCLADLREQSEPEARQQHAAHYPARDKQRRP